MPPASRFRHQSYRSEPPTSPYRLLPSGPPAAPSSPEFAARIAGAGRQFLRAGVVAVYCVHGTFGGDDGLGLLTELEPYASRLSQSLRKHVKRAIDAILGETGNYTPTFAARLETHLSIGADRPLPVRLFNWSSQDNHIGRADAAVRLIDELATLAVNNSFPAPSPLRGGLGRGANPSQLATTPPLTPPRPGEGNGPAPRVLLWGHSHGGNVFALISNLLGADAAARAEFFHAARSFYHTWLSNRVAFPAWQRVEDLLAEASHPLRRLQLDFVTFGTPIRYGWDAGGYGKLLHFINHRPAPHRPHHLAIWPPRLHRIAVAADGDFIQQVGVAGTNLPPIPLAVRTFLADWRLGRLLQRELPGWSLYHRLKHGTRVPDEGTTLLVDYDDPARFPLHLFGHAAYTRSRWLPLHCELVAEEFYGRSSSSPTASGGNNPKADST